MNPFLLAGIIALAVAATGAYFFGRRKNKALAGIFSKEAALAFHATSTEYVNIGGCIGYNFVYKLKEPWTEAKGTMTFIPRQSLLYVPFSIALGARDRFFVNIFTKKKLVGEGHILSVAYYRKNGGVIPAQSRFTKEQYRQGQLDFILLYEDEAMAKRLKALLADLPSLGQLRHFCSYPENSTIFLFLRPVPGAVAAMLERLLPALNGFLR